MRELEPSISDWEALYLHRDAMLYFPPVPEESLKVCETKGRKIYLENGKALLEKGWLGEFRKEDRTYPTDLPENAKKHLKWLHGLGKESESTDESDGGGRSQRSLHLSPRDWQLQENLQDGRAEMTWNMGDGKPCLPIPLGLNRETVI